MWIILGIRVAITVNNCYTLQISMRITSSRIPLKTLAQKKHLIVRRVIYSHIITINTVQYQRYNQCKTGLEHGKASYNIYDVDLNPIPIRQYFQSSNQVYSLICVLISFLHSRRCNGDDLAVRIVFCSVQSVRLLYFRINPYSHLQVAQLVIIYCGNVVSIKVDSHGTLADRIRVCNASCKQAQPKCSCSPLLSVYC